PPIPAPPLYTLPQHDPLPILAAAQAVGEKYLAAWSHDDEARELRLTSPLSAGTATDLAGLRKAKRQRLDEGVCPLSDTGDLHLRSEEHTSELQSHLNCVCRLF